MRPSLALALACCTVAAPALAQQPSTPLAGRLDSLTRAWVASSHAPGVSVAVVRGRDTLLMEGVGLRDRERALPATPATVYRVGSITKQFTAAAVMQLVEQGRVKLTDPMTKYLPQYPQWNAVTVRQLLDHTSGIHSYTSSAVWRGTWNTDLTPAQLVAFVEKDTMDFAPGTHWAYNNTGYILLGMLLDRVTGVPYPRYVKEHFFVPLGMRSAGYCASVPDGADDAKGYVVDADTVGPAPYLSMSHPYAAGALCMSVRDFLRWQTALTGGRVVSPASYAMMARSDTLSTGRPTNYGFGLAPGALGTHRKIEHGGAVHGFLSEQAWFPDDSLRVVVFTNAMGVHPDSLANALAAAALGIELPKPVAERPFTAFKPAPTVPMPAPAAQFTGTYDVRLPNGVTLVTHVAATPAGLTMQADGPGQGAFPLRYVGDGQFAADFDPTLRVQFVMVGDHATAMRVVQHGQTMEGARRP